MPLPTLTKQLIKKKKSSRVKPRHPVKITHQRRLHSPHRLIPGPRPFFTSYLMKSTPSSSMNNPLESQQTQSPVSAEQGEGEPHPLAMENEDDDNVIMSIYDRLGSSATNAYVPTNTWNRVHAVDPQLAGTGSRDSSMSPEPYPRRYRRPYRTRGWTKGHLEWLMENASDQASWSVLAKKMKDHAEERGFGSDWPKTGSAIASFVKAHTMRGVRRMLRGEKPPPHFTRFEREKLIKDWYPLVTGERWPALKSKFRRESERPGGKHKFYARYAGDLQRMLGKGAGCRGVEGWLTLERQAVEVGAEEYMMNG